MLEVYDREYQNYLNSVDLDDNESCAEVMSYEDWKN